MGWVLLDLLSQFSYVNIDDAVNDSSLITGIETIQKLRPDEDLPLERP
jgi:hypothetical protein